jgi:hypothetical protein
MKRPMAGTYTSVDLTVGLRKSKLWSTRFVYYVHINITLNTPLRSLLLTHSSEAPSHDYGRLHCNETLLRLHHLSLPVCNVHVYESV